MVDMKIRSDSSLLVMFQGREPARVAMWVSATLDKTSLHNSKKVRYRRMAGQRIEISASIKERSGRYPHMISAYKIFPLFWSVVDRVLCRLVDCF